jgi:Xaa-Pro aminopeptidase
MIPFYFEKPVYARRRKKLFENLKPNQDLVIFFSGHEKTKTHDNHYFFQPDNSFLYLTGFAEAGAALLMWTEKKGARVISKFHMFVPPRDREKEQWNGFRYGIEGVKKESNCDESFDFKDLKEKVVQWLMTVPSPGVRPHLHTNIQAHSEYKVFLDEVVRDYCPPHRLAKLPIEAIFDFRPKVEALRLIKDKDEITLMRKSSEINVKAHLDVIHAIKPGMKELELQGIVEGAFLKYGASGTAYTSICAAASNATVLHYNTNLDKLRDGDLFLIDAGCQYKFYCSDITRTLPANGKYSDQQRVLMDIVSESQQEVFRLSRPGSTMPELHKAASLVIIEGLKTLKILKGSSQEIFNKGQHKRYYPHGTGHWLGLDVHDANPYFDEKGRPLKLSAGMIYTVEPGIYFMKDDQTVAKEWRGLGVRTEDDVLITGRGMENLTQDLPRTATEIEKEMK